MTGMNSDTVQNMMFFWIPKTAGTAVFSFLKQEFNAQKIICPQEFHKFSGRGYYTFGHISYLILRSLGVVGDKFDRESFKFGIVRCPYRRAVSLYNYLIFNGTIPRNLDFTNFIKIIAAHRPPVGIYNVHGLSQANPQADWLVTGKGQFLVDKIFKFENLNELADAFRHKYGAVFLQRRLENTSPNLFTFEEFLKSEEAIKHINIIYHRDFVLFGYDMLT